MYSTPTAENITATARPDASRSRGNLRASVSAATETTTVPTTMGTPSTSVDTGHLLELQHAE